MTTLASFYAPRPEHPNHVYDFVDCLRLQRETCERYGVRQIVITDWLGGFDGIETFHTDLPHSLMPAILAGQLALLQSGIHDDLILTGADCLLGRDPSELFDHSDFDLAITTHPFADCILNTGMMAVAAGSADLVAAIWRNALGDCGDAWGDDQLALARYIEPTLEHGSRTLGSLYVRQLPVPGYNEAPDDAEHKLNPVPLIVHFRGPRKRWMRAWAARCLQ
jgi:hypothetical protein